MAPHSSTLALEIPWTAEPGGLQSMGSGRSPGEFHGQGSLVGYGILLLLLSRFSRVQLCATPWTAAYQVPPSMGFSGQQYWSGVPLPSPQGFSR